LRRNENSGRSNTGTGQNICREAAAPAQAGASPIPEKVDAVIQLQEMIATILRARGKSLRPWSIANTATEIN